MQPASPPGVGFDLTASRRRWRWLFWDGSGPSGGGDALLTRQEVPPSVLLRFNKASRDTISHFLLPPAPGFTPESLSSSIIVFLSSRILLRTDVGPPVGSWWFRRTGAFTQRLLLISTAVGLIIEPANVGQRHQEDPEPPPILGGLFPPPGGSRDPAGSLVWNQDGARSRG